MTTQHNFNIIFMEAIHWDRHPVMLATQ